MDKLLYTPMEAAEQLGVGRTMLFQLLRDGRLKSVKVDRKRLIPGAELERFVAERLRRATGEDAGTHS